MNNLQPFFPEVMQQANALQSSQISQLQNQLTMPSTLQFPQQYQPQQMPLEQYPQPVVQQSQSTELKVQQNGQQHFFRKITRRFLTYLGLYEEETVDYCANTANTNIQMRTSQQTCNSVQNNSYAVTQSSQTNYNQQPQSTSTEMYIKTTANNGIPNQSFVPMQSYDTGDNLFDLSKKLMFEICKKLFGQN